MQQQMQEFSPFEDYGQCPSCGSKLLELHSKTMCTRCGYRRGCCDVL